MNDNAVLSISQTVDNNAEDNNGGPTLIPRITMHQ